MIVLEDSVAGASAPENWITTGPKKNAPERPCANCTTKAELDEWKKEIFTGHKGGPESKDAIEYMKESNVQIIGSASDINNYLERE